MQRQSASRASPTRQHGWCSRPPYLHRGLHPAIAVRRSRAPNALWKLDTSLPAVATHTADSCPSTPKSSQHLLPTHPTGVLVARGFQVLQALLKLWLLVQRHTNTPTSPGTAAHPPFSSQVQHLLSDLGPLWVKLGQTLAVRPDVVGLALAAALSGLQESAPAFPDSTAAAILQEEFGAPPSEVFAWWSEKPVAAASLGQVYQAKMHGGTVVAVKVQRPGMWFQISLDLTVLTELLRLLRWVGRIKQDITLWADTLGEGLAQELDYVQEGRNLTEFAAAHDYLGFVTTPQVVWELTTHRVLTTTWMDGQTPAQILRSLQEPQNTGSTTGASAHTLKGADTSQRAAAPDVRHKPPLQQAQQQRAQQQQQLLQLVHLGIQASLHQLMVSGCLHADPHPGNLLLSGGNMLVYLDFGLLVRVPPEASMAMMAALLHWSQANWLALASDMKHMGLLKPTTDLQELADDLSLRFSQLYAAGSQPPPTATAAAAGPATAVATRSAARTGTASTLLQEAGAIGFAEFAGVIAALALKYRFELPPYFTLIIRSLTTLEGFALVVDPSARYSIARTAVKVVACQLLFDQRPAAQALLREVLVLQDAPGQPGHLNLPLLEDLLTLATPHFQPATATAAAVTPAAAALASQGGSGWGAFSSSSSLQVLDLTVLLQQQLGVPAAVAAAQLSSREAAGVRVLLAQQLLHRWLPAGGHSQSKQHVHALWSAGHSEASAPPKAVSASVQSDAGCLGGQEASCRDRDPQHAKGKGAFRHLWAWVASAGWSGVELAWQLVCLCVGLLAIRSVAWMQRCLQKPCPAV